MSSLSGSSLINSKWALVMVLASFLSIGALPWYLALFPVTLSLDSLDQLWQSAGWKPIEDYHSVVMTLILRALFQRADFYAVIQILVFGFSVSFAAVSAIGGFRPLNEVHLSRRTVFIVALSAGIMALSPAVGFYLNAVVKDVPFAAALLIGATFWAKSLTSRDISLLKAPVLGVLSATPLFFRYDGFIFLVLAILASVLLIRAQGRPGKKWEALFLLFTTLTVGTRFALPSVVGALPGPSSWAWSVAFVHDLAAVATLGGDLDERDKHFLNSFTSVQKLQERYDIIHGDSPYYPPERVDLRWLSEKKSTFWPGYMRIVAKNSTLVIKQRLRRTASHLGFGHQWIFSDPIENPKNSFGLNLRPVWAKEWLPSFLRYTRDTLWLRPIVWAAGIPIMLLVALAIWALRRNEVALFLIAITPVVQIFGFSIISHASYVRYNFHVLPFLFLGLCTIGGIYLRHKYAQDLEFLGAISRHDSALIL